MAFHAPGVEQSILPGVLGLDGLRRVGAILDLRNMEMYLTETGGYSLIDHLPEGTERYKLEIAPTGHMMLPCSEFSGAREQEREAERTAVSALEARLEAVRAPTWQPDSQQ